ncbi:hypothetical protein C9374_008212 [Naegleria lovaniensis]|uniref:F-box domain-containing protein n=1 Tax=Naegleria lovaniensis TaxID=51637 RepID=A0AA88GHD3_NAELO|nr:uncharacterized protein C9374_008212 [Naegleria lovaniensis]KAG2378573.1 hypothetical protein C9374_008212 [Naegleria lovaniensis]
MSQSQRDHDWNELPIEICGEILSFLPVLPNFFIASRVCKAWQEQVERLLTSFDKELDRYNFHLHFGYVNASKLAFHDLLKLIFKCRGVKKITLCNMIFSSEVAHVLGLTRVEQLTIFNCTIQDTYLTSDREGSISLPFRSITENECIRTLSQSYPVGRKAIKDTRLFQDFLEISVVSKYFPHLKNILLINTFGHLVIDGEDPKNPPPITFTKVCSTNELSRVNLENVDLAKVTEKQPSDQGDSKSSETTSSGMSYFNTSFQLICSSYFSDKDVLAAVITLTSGQQIAVMALRLSSHKEVRLRNSRSQWKELPAIYCNTFNQWLEVLKKYQLTDCLDPNMLRGTSFTRIKECFEFGLISPFSELSRGYSCLEHFFLEEMLRTVSKKVLKSNAKNSEDLIVTKKKSEHPTPANYSEWEQQACVKECISVIEWIHTNKPSLIDLDNSAVKNALRACKNIDKEWKQWFSKSVKKVASAPEQQPSNFIYWYNFLLSGKKFEPAVNDPIKEKRVEEDSEFTQKAKKKKTK